MATGGLEIATGVNPIYVWRITRYNRVADAFSGVGAMQMGGRWNSQGVRCLYAASSAALAMLEILAHGIPTDQIPTYYGFRVALNPDEIEVPDRLPFGWDTRPPSEISQEFGDMWIDSGRSLALAVPSVVMPIDRNCLVNPAHPAWSPERVEGSFAMPLGARLTGHGY